MPVSPTSSSTRPRADGRSVTEIVPLERELEGVREQVEHDLLPHLRIDVDRLRQRRAGRRRAQPGALDRRPERAREVRRERRQIGRLERRLRASGLDAREIEQRVHELQQPEHVACADCSSSPRERPGRCQRVLDRAQHERQGRAELVADVAEEGRLGAIELRQGVRAAALVFIRARARESGANLPDDETHEVPVRVIEHADRG